MPASGAPICHLHVQQRNRTHYAKASRLFEQLINIESPTKYELAGTQLRHCGGEVGGSSQKKIGVDQHKGPTLCFNRSRRQQIGKEDLWAANDSRCIPANGIMGNECG